MNLHDACDIIGTTLERPLGRVSKMAFDVPTYGLPAWACHRGTFLRRIPGSVCEHCYAHNGNYRFPGVQRAMSRRLDAITNRQWAQGMASVIRAVSRRDKAYFRHFDTGDLQSVEHLAKIVEVCERTPWVRHWLPTHEPFIVEEFGVKRLPENLCVRISADFVEHRPTTPTFGLPTSTVHMWEREPVPASTQRRKDSIECGAYRRGNNCGSCRACWEPRLENVSYLKHN